MKRFDDSTGRPGITSLGGDVIMVRCSDDPNHCLKSISLVGGPITSVRG